MPDFGCVGRVGGAMLERRRKSGKERGGGEMKAKGKRLLGRGGWGRVFVLWYNSDMQNLLLAAVLGVIATSALFVKKDPDKVERTMTVNRCQAVLKDGTQCKSQVEGGKDFCWKHRTAKAFNETLADTKEGSKKAWESTKSWSTNAWESTKAGWNKAVDATKDSVDGARVGMVELLGGKDAKKSEK